MAIICCSMLIGINDGGFAQQTATTDDYFPLHKGGYAIYAAHVEWTESTGPGRSVQTKQADITWRSEVVDVFQRNRLRAVRIKGFVHDLCWYEPGKPPGDYLIIQVGPTHYHLITTKVDELWTKIITSEGDPYLEELDADNLLLEVPLVVGATYGEFSQTPRGAYCYVVTDEIPFDARSIAGAPNLANPSEFSIRYQTSPGHSITGFVPRLGITSFDYRHHGTVATCRVRLVEFHR